MNIFTTSDGCRLFYETRGESAGKPFVVFLNGFTQTTVYWYGRVRAFSRHFSILLYDARGQGQSDAGLQRMTLDRHSRDLVELLTHLRIQKTSLVGLSHGARVALAFTAGGTIEIKRLVLCGIGAGDSRKVGETVDAWYSALESGRPSVMAEAILPSIFGRAFFERHRGIMTDIARAVVERNRTDALLAQLKALADYPPPESYRIPESAECLVLSGSEDGLVSPAAAERLAGLLNGRCEVIANAGHSIPIEAPETFDRLALDFLIGPEAAGRK